MKIKFNLNLLINLIILGYTGFLVINAVWIFEPTDRVTIGIVDTTENNLKPIYPEISDSISHWQYAEKQDSIKRIRSFQNGRVEIGWNATIGHLLSVSTIKYCDTCSLKTLQSPAWADGKRYDRYFIKLLSWKIKVAKLDFAYPDSIQYYVHSGQPFVRKEVEFPLKEKPNHFIARWVDEPVKYWYNERDDSIMIPMAESTSQIARIILAIFVIFGMGYSLWLFGSCLHFILDVSKGLAFTSDNVRRLKLLALTLLFYPLVIFVLNFLLRWLFNSYFNEDVVLNNTIWFDSRSIMVIGIVVWFLFKAFQQGKKLKDEQDLTV